MIQRRSFLKSLVSALIALPMAAELARFGCSTPDVVEARWPEAAPRMVLTQAHLDYLYGVLIADEMSGL